MVVKRLFKAVFKSHYGFVHKTKDVRQQLVKDEGFKMFFSREENLRIPLKSYDVVTLDFLRCSKHLVSVGFV